LLPVTTPGVATCYFFLEFLYYNKEHAEEEIYSC